MANSNEKCTIFICKKCEHNLYVSETSDFIDKIAMLTTYECPNCGEEGYENWILSHRKKVNIGEWVDS